MLKLQSCERVGWDPGDCWLMGGKVPPSWGGGGGETYSSCYILVNLSHRDGRNKICLIIAALNRRENQFLSIN